MLWRSSFLSDLYCSHSEVKLVAKIKLIAEKEEEGFITEWAVLLVGDREGHCSNPGVVNIFAPLKKNLSRLQPLN